MMTEEKSQILIDSIAWRPDCGAARPTGEPLPIAASISATPADCDSEDKIRHIAKRLISRGIDRVAKTFEELGKALPKARSDEPSPSPKGAAEAAETGTKKAGSRETEKASQVKEQGPPSGHAHFPAAGQVQTKPDLEWFRSHTLSGARLLKDLRVRKNPREAHAQTAQIFWKLQTMFLVSNSTDLFKGIQESVKTKLNRLDADLSRLGKDLDAVERPGGPRLFLRQVEENANDLHESLESVLPDAKSDDETSTIQKLTLISDKNKEVLAEAVKATDCLDRAEILEIQEKICRGLEAMWDTYGELLCELRATSAPPGIGANKLMMLEADLGSVGFYISESRWALAQIDLPEENPIARLIGDWDAVHQQANLLRDELRRWAAQQLCPPVDCCQGEVDRLLLAVRSGRQAAEALRAAPACPEARREMIRLLDDASYETYRLYRKTEGHTPFDRTVFTPFWGPVFRIRAFLDPCLETKDDCLLTEGKLATLLEMLRGVQASESGGGLGRQAPCREAPSPAAAGVVTEAPVSSEAALQRWRPIIEAAKRLRPQLPDPLGPAIDQVIHNGERAQRQLQILQRTGDVFSMEMAREMERQQQLAYTTLHAADAIVRDRSVWQRNTGIAQPTLPSAHQGLRGFFPSR